MPEETKSPEGSGTSPPVKKEGGAKKKEHGQGGANAKGFAPRAPKFEGKCPELKGHIYDASDARQSDQFIKTTREISEYIGRTYKYGGDMRLAVETLTAPTLVPPADYTDDATRTEIRIWEKMVDEHARRISGIDEHIKSLYSLVWGQCSDVVRQKVESNENFEEVARTGNGIGLLIILKGISFHFQSQKYACHSIHEALKRFYNCSQGRFATTQAYMEHFTNVMDVVTQSGGSILGHTGIEDAIIKEKELNRDNLTAAELSTIVADAEARTKAIAFLLGCDRSRYGKLVEDLENDFLQGRNNYPKTVVGAYNLLTNWKQENRFGWRAPQADGVAFTTDGKKAPTKKTVTCHKCGVKGHYATECPEITGRKAEDAAQSGTTMLMAGIEDGEFDNEPNFTFVNHGVSCQMGEDGRLPKTWILLDNQSTVDVFYNAELLTNIRIGNGSMDIHCNAGIASTNQVGELNGYGTVWYHPDGIANILSLSRVKEQGYRVVYDSEGGNHFKVIKSDGTIRTFSESKRGLYYLDTSNDSKDNSHEDEDEEEEEEDDGHPETTLINTVADNCSKYTNRAYLRATTARRIQQMIGRPSTREFIKIVDQNLLPNCPVTRADIMAAEKIFGPDLGILKGKTVRKQTDHVDTDKTEISIPSDLSLNTEMSPLEQTSCLLTNCRFLSQCLATSSSLRPNYY